MMVHRKRDLDRARAEHDRDLDPDKPTKDNELYVPSRSQDTSLWWLMSYYMQKYVALWAPLALIGSAFGFTLVTPKRAADEIRARVDSVAAYQQSQITVIKADQASLRALIDTNNRGLSLLLRSACVSRAMSIDTKQLIGLVDAKGECIR